MSISRREFLTSAVTSAAVMSLDVTTPGIWAQAAAAARRDADTILVVVQLSGGNDGLNTVVPRDNDDYRRARPTLAISESSLLPINDQLGFHPQLPGFAELLAAQGLTVVQGVGYPEPNRSHFESMDIWHTCRRKGEARRDGWLGRFLEAARPPSGYDIPALHLGGEQQPLALASRRVPVPSVRSLDSFRLRDVSSNEQRAAIRAAITAERKQPDNDLLGFVQTSAAAALEASRQVGARRGSYQARAEYPESRLAAKLKVIAQLIHAGLSPRVYYVAIDGFDTHAKQADAHAALLSEVSGGVSAFVNDMRRQGHGDRVAVVCFSEFGRRVRENGSAGTDHGAAAPMFVAGGRLQSGVIGEHPSLTELVNGDLKFQVDFRQVYATLLEHWLGWPSQEILGDEYERLPIFS